MHFLKKTSLYFNVLFIIRINVFVDKVLSNDKKKERHQERMAYSMQPNGLLVVGSLIPSTGFHITNWLYSGCYSLSGAQAMYVSRCVKIKNLFPSVLLDKKKLNFFLIQWERYSVHIQSTYLYLMCVCILIYLYTHMYRWEPSLIYRS